MSFYLDTSVIVATLTPEDASPRVRQWLERRRDAALNISEWVGTEVSAALSIKVRNRDLTEQAQAIALSAFAVMRSDNFVLLPIDASAFRRAANLADRSQFGLRSGDALHLAIVEPTAMPLVTLDKRLAKAGHGLGIATLLL